MKYLRIFNNVDSLYRAKSNGELVGSVDNAVYVEKCSHWVSKYDVKDTTKPTTLIGENFTSLTDDNAYMQIDGVEQNQMVKEYQFETTGQHEVSLDSIVKIDNTDYMYEGATELVGLDFSQANQSKITTATGMFDESVKDIVKENQIGVTSEVIIEAEKKDEPEFEMVDLGLPSGIKWAKCNVGADTESDYGLYFQWGDTVGYEGNEAKAHSTWKTAPFNNGSSNYDNTYYPTVKDSVCPNGVLAQEYDAAHVHMGGGWRMPTKDEISELRYNTTRSWVENYNGTGINGCKFTNKNDSEKYIFIPVAGFYGEGWNNYENEQGGLWSSSQPSDAMARGYRFYFYKNMYSENDKDYRYYAQSVRGVHA